MECGSAFLDILVHMGADEEQLDKLIGGKMVNMKNKVLEELRIKHKTSADTIKRVMGMYMREQLESHKEFSKLKEECELILEDYDVLDSDNDSI